METASLYIQTIGVVLPGTMSHVIISDMKKVKERCKDVNERKIYKSSRVVLKIKINSNDTKRHLTFTGR